MYELFKTNAAICVQMAAATSSHEFRGKWNELAAHGESEADAY